MHVINKVDGAEPQSFYQFIKLLENYGSRPAASTSDEKIKYSYAELAGQIKKFAVFLSGQIKAGDRVMLINMDGPHWVVAFFAILLNKAIAVPVDHRMSEKLQQEIQELVEAAAVISCKSITSAINKKIIFEQESMPDAKNWEELPTETDTPAEIIFTSGTWGKPKGVTLSHGNILSNARGLTQVYDLAPGSKFLSVLPLSHAYEQVPGLLAPLMKGAHLVYQSSLDSFSLLASMQQYHPAYMVIVPKFLDIFKDRIEERIKKYLGLFKLFLNISILLPVSFRRLVFYRLQKQFGGKLREFIVGGAPLSVEVERFFRALGFKFLVGYGLSESAPVLTVFLEEPRPKNCVGKALPGVSISIAPDEEIIAEGPNIFLGYWPLSGARVQTLHTGDLGYLDEDGRLFITGRKKNMVVFGTGDKIQLEDIEDIADGFTGVTECCAISIEKDRGSISLGLLYIGPANSEQLLSYINSRLPLFGRLRFAKQWPDNKFPRSHLLKLQRKLIQEAYENF